MGSGHTVFASGHVTNRGINVQTDTNQDQGCEGAGGTSGITNACTATSGRGSTETSTETQVTLSFGFCTTLGRPNFFTCPPGQPNPPDCNNIGCQGVTCGFNPFGGTGNCITNNGVQLTSCTVAIVVPNSIITCTRTETTTVPGTGITQSGGVSG
jgi:hypothetical protein